MADFIQGLDPSKLVLAETILSFIISPFTAPPYNLAIFLFGIYAIENTEGTLSLQTFTGLLGISTLYDLIWMIRNEQNGFIKLITIIILLFKIPTLLAFVTAVRAKGVQFSGLGSRGGDMGGPTVWSMPGGFTSSLREGYQTVDEESGTHQTKPTTAVPTSNSHTTTPAALGAYQNVS